MRIFCSAEKRRRVVLRICLSTLLALVASPSLDCVTTSFVTFDNPCQTPISEEFPRPSSIPGSLSYPNTVMCPNYAEGKQIHGDDEEARRAGEALAEAIVPKLAHQKGSGKEWVN